MRTILGQNRTKVGKKIGTIQGQNLSLIDQKRLTQIRNNLHKSKTHGLN